MEEKENNALGVDESKPEENKEETKPAAPETDEAVAESYKDKEEEILVPTDEEVKEADRETEKEEKYAEKEEDKVVEVRAKKLNTARWEELEAILAKGNIRIWEAMNLSQETYEKIKSNNERIHLSKAHVFGALLKHCTWLDVLNVKHKMPRGTTVIMKTKKIQILAKYLRENHNLTFARAISLSDKRSKSLQTGNKVPTMKECLRIARYFLMSPKYILDDNLELPPVDKIKIDETIASIQRHDFENEVKLEKNKHFIARNWQILSHGRRMRLIAHLVLTIVPLTAYTAACAYTIIKDRFETIEKYQQNDNSQVLTEKEAYDSYNVGDTYEEAINKYLTNNAFEEKYIANVKVGTQIVKIGSISPSTSSYGVAMRLWMDFDVNEYHEMLMKKADPNYSGALEDIKQGMYNYSKKARNSNVSCDPYYDPDSNPVTDEQAEEVMKLDQFSYNSNTDAFEFKGIDGTLDRKAATELHFMFIPKEYSCGDGIPDYIQIKDFSPSMCAEYLYNKNYNNIEGSDIPAEKLDAWDLERSQYPLETSSDNYPDKETMFIVGNGEIDAHSFSYEVGQNYTLTDEDTGDTEYRFFSCCYFDATIRKAFDNPRYPLDSVQFHIYIMPMQMLVSNIRYIPTETVALNTAGNPGYVCSIEGQTFTTGVSPVFMMSSGYKLISKYKNFVTRTYYYTDENYTSHPDWSQFKTEYEVLIRANRQGFNLFLQAFMNLFCVAIWITIAFYSQSHQGENQLGMMGTGLFAGISSILVGLSMVSDAGIISMITMINIFTLAVILIMTGNCIEARTYQVKEDLVGQAFNGIKMRIMFYILMACTIIMFVGLPICGFIWGL